MNFSSRWFAVTTAIAGFLLALYIPSWRPLATKSAELLLTYSSWASTALIPQNDICYDYQEHRDAALLPGYKVAGGVCTYELVERIHDIALFDDDVAEANQASLTQASSLRHSAYPLLDWEATSDPGDSALALVEGRLWPLQYDVGKVLPVTAIPRAPEIVDSLDTPLRPESRIKQKGVEESLASPLTPRGEAQGKYSIYGKFAGGAFGEVWRAAGDDEVFVLKRMFVEKGEYVRLSGLREVHFGQILQSEPHIARFVEFFNVERVSADDIAATTSPSPTPGTAAAATQAPSGHHQHLIGPMPSDYYGDDNGATASSTSELWLVFRDEGKSLHDMLYDGISEGNRLRFVRSKFWMQLKSRDGLVLLKEMIRQLLTALLACHSRGITHRDVKPQNVLIDVRRGSDMEVKLADFGSAVDGFSSQQLYGESGPSKDENTLAYAPPEVLFGDAPLDSKWPHSYDIWSLGILVMELVLGTAHVFQVDSRLRAFVDQQMAGKPTGVRHAAHMYQAMQQFCLHDLDNDRLNLNIPKPVVGGKARGKMKPTECTSDTFAKQLRRLDPNHMGLPSHTGLDLLKRMLAWDPQQRISAQDALDHAFFANEHAAGDEPFRCSCGMEFMMLRDYTNHKRLCSVS